ncbi:hypothetical protein EVAR_11515_1 [Eumeta japonica]|uniref:Integrase catalytic domain-containing protein n=1 Tax=Eumeta variegata TaxID=151549 RepID=A0A4C1TYP5_EUMVA|nr:hypothetical protein EVAR_11515_1 [Eumeta japonica]
MTELRQQYWLVLARSTLRVVAHGYQRCRVRKSWPTAPPTADLPVERLASYKRPFTCCGVDYFRPVNVTIGRSRAKRYCALFTCLTTRAGNMEIAHTLSTDSAIMALRRMAARHGWPRVICSDNSTNFRGADVELRAAYHGRKKGDLFS